MIKIDIFINERKIAVAAAVNKSALSGESDYEVVAVSEASPVTGLPRVEHSFHIMGHDRTQSAWALVAKIAQAIADLERK